MIVAAPAESMTVTASARPPAVLGKRIVIDEPPFEKWADFSGFGHVVRLAGEGFMHAGELDISCFCEAR
ncbi:hypothetical protein FXF51_59930 [Nonomuraea sp. PA05]|uniref:hypothetical protein n=1 Tax=Nonomuraea sp. PA05 TaxID=2604466 RepID=UPI0011D3791D|nr:hypothetical protein [Nonomuraea sp. PA05]TYB45822.1 hypothetical protein FXF51_59930 [Nonomuraea sp. PA05]